MDWDDEQVVYYVQTDEGEIQLDDKAKVNPRPHILYQVDGDDNTYIDSLGFLPFFRLDNNKKQFSNLKAVKDLIDDYDLMASSLSNNLIASQSVIRRSSSGRFSALVPVIPSSK